MSVENVFPWGLCFSCPPCVFHLFLQMDVGSWPRPVCPSAQPPCPSHPLPLPPGHQWPSHHTVLYNCYRVPGLENPVLRPLALQLLPPWPAHPARPCLSTELALLQDPSDLRVGVPPCQPSVLILPGPSVACTENVPEPPSRGGGTRGWWGGLLRSVSTSWNLWPVPLWSRASGGHGGRILWWVGRHLPPHQALLSPCHLSEQQFRPFF